MSVFIFSVEIPVTPVLEAGLLPYLEKSHRMEKDTVGLSFGLSS